MFGPPRRWFPTRAPQCTSERCSTTTRTRPAAVTAGRLAGRDHHCHILVPMVRAREVGPPGRKGLGGFGGFRVPRGSARVASPLGPVSQTNRSLHRGLTCKDDMLVADAMMFRVRRGSGAVRLAVCVAAVLAGRAAGQPPTAAPSPNVSTPTFRTVYRAHVRLVVAVSGGPASVLAATPAVAVLLRAAIATAVGLVRAWYGDVGGRRGGGRGPPEGDASTRTCLAPADLAHRCRHQTMCVSVKSTSQQPATYRCPHPHPTPTQSPAAPILPPIRPSPSRRRTCCSSHSVTSGACR
jgi:hypothetical protein